MSSSNPLKRPFIDLGSYITRSQKLLKEIEEDEKAHHLKEDEDLDISCREYLPSFVLNKTEESERENTPPPPPLPPPIIASPKIALEPIPTSVDTHVKSQPVFHSPKIIPVNQSDFFPGYHSAVGHKGPVEPRCQDQIVVNGKKYLVLKPVGEGGSGKVYQVFSNEHTDVFALKWVKVRNKEELDNVRNEMHFMRLLKDSGHTIHLYDHEITPQVVYMIMEYGELDFASLIKMQSSKEWDITFIRYFWKQMLMAVHATHGKDIIHSDLKPANFIVINGTLKLIDFGIAAVVPDYTTHIERDYQVGTKNYMAPETLLEGGKQGRPSDIWSLGCILYQMVFGFPPFFDVPRNQMTKAITNLEHTISFPHHAKYAGEIVNVPENLTAVLRMCLQRNPQLRPTMLELLNTDF